MLLLLVLLAVITLIFHFLRNHRKNGQFHPPPGPKGLPLIGNLHQYDTSEPHVYLYNLAKIYGPILYLRLGRVPMVVIQSAEIAKEVLKSQDHNLCSRPLRTGQQKLSYNGLDMVFSPYNDNLREIKKLCIIHLFSSKRVQSFAPIRKDEVSRMINHVSSLSSASKIINLNDLLMALTTSIICRIAFGKRYEDDGVERSRFHNLLNEAQAVFTAFFFSDHFPLMGWLDKLTGLSCRLERIFKNYDAFYEEIINEHLHQDKPESDQETIIDVLLQLWKERSFTFELSLDHIKAVLMDIFVAGTDTTAVMLVWAMTELVKNPMVMRKAQEEMRCANHGKTFIEEEDLSNLEYLKAVVKESFRLHPAGPLLISHEAIKKCCVQGYDILPKTTICVNAWAIGRDPKLWKDPEVFMPERFLGSHIDFRGHDFELIPFGAGRRICTGMNLGVVTFELALANLLYSFDWEFPIGTKKEEIDDTQMLPGLSMFKKNPLCLIARRYA